MLFVYSKEITTSTSVGDVVVLRIHSHLIRSILVLRPISDDLIPWSRTDVLHDDQGRAMPLDPGHHTLECTGRLSPIVNALLLVVQIGEVYAGGSGNEKIYVSWYRCKSTIDSCAMEK